MMQPQTVKPSNAGQPTDIEVGERFEAIGACARVRWFIIGTHSLRVALMHVHGALVKVDAAAIIQIIHQNDIFFLNLLWEASLFKGWGWEITEITITFANRHFYASFF